MSRTTKKRVFVSLALLMGLATAQQTEGMRPADAYLLEAARSGNLVLSWFALEKFGASVNARNEQDFTPLHIACRYGHLDIAKLLVKKGANIEAMITHNQATPLNIACSFGHLPIVEFLVTNGAKISAQGAEQRSPLYNASDFDQYAIAQYLLSKGAPVNEKSPQRLRWTALHWARSAEIAQLLLDNGANINDDSNAFGKAPLHEHCSYSGNRAVVKILLDRGFPVNKKTKYGETPLLLAFNSGFLPVVKLLIARGADIEKTYTLSEPTPKKERICDFLDTIRSLLGLTKNSLSPEQLDKKIQADPTILSTLLQRYELKNEYIRAYELKRFACTQLWDQALAKTSKKFQTNVRTGGWNGPRSAGKEPKTNGLLHALTNGSLANVQFAFNE